jgi:hypothetical protein
VRKSILSSVVGKKKVVGYKCGPKWPAPVSFFEFAEAKSDARMVLKVLRMFRDAVGIGTAMEDSLEGLIAEGRLVQVRKDWCPTFRAISSTIPAAGISLPRLPRLLTPSGWISGAKWDEQVLRRRSRLFP